MSQVTWSVFLPNFFMGSKQNIIPFVKRWRLVSTFILTNKTCFFISNTFTSNTRLKLAKNHAKSKQNPEAKLLLFENYSLSSSMLSSNDNKIDLGLGMDTNILNINLGLNMGTYTK